MGRAHRRLRAHDEPLPPRGRAEAEDSFEYAIGRTNQLYAEYINRLHGRTGRLWQARYNSNPMDERHTLFAMRYVERNPVRARMVARAEDYPWSSAAAHCGGRDPSGLLDLAAWNNQGTSTEFSERDGPPGGYAARVMVVLAGEKLGRRPHVSTIDRMASEVSSLPKS